MAKGMPDGISLNWFADYVALNVTATNESEIGFADMETLLLTTKRKRSIYASKKNEML